MSLDLYEVAWAAGFFDGEGTCHANFNKTKTTATLRINVSQVEIELLERFQKAVGGFGKIRFIEKNGFKQNHIYSYYTNKHMDAVSIVFLLFPFLSAPKRNQIKRYYNLCTKTIKEGTYL